jgi:hypothetical protein
MSINIQDPLHIMPNVLVPSNPPPYPYPPPILVKHPQLYFDDTDLFISQWETLCRLHQQYFNTPYFDQLLITIDPGRTAARGTMPSLPIPFNDISTFTFITFVHLLYQPNNFQINAQGWKNIENLAEEWGFPYIVLHAMEAQQELDRQCYVPLQRLMQLPIQT